MRFSQADQHAILQRRQKKHELRRGHANICTRCELANTLLTVLLDRHETVPFTRFNHSQKLKLV
ncbi:hypothetical protein SAMN05421858_4721 [Haladaptatus litoreus]|uniref:Uncharacterized protein n=1 Tax=Haladaptatus litoreus TaxID=553468 RepID=A0A1N7F1P6_9EURY|nr:hypothetical protein SAMN05421858_4721 [Haladaptatus litoreus]